MLKRFPDMEEQAQIKDILDKMETKKCVRRNYLPFLKYLEISDPGLLNYTTFLAKVDKRLFHIFNVLNESGCEKILTLCHGDSKPDNFLFRKIEIDLEDMECEGLESILIDWQGGFLGSISNDLMWLLPPFLEAGAGLEEALLHYATQVDIIYTVSTVYLQYIYISTPPSCCTSSALSTPSPSTACPRTPPSWSGSSRGASSWSFSMSSSSSMQVELLGPL